MPIVVDSLGLLFVAGVTIASVQTAMEQNFIPEIAGSGKKLRKVLDRYSISWRVACMGKSKFKLVLEVVLHSDKMKGFVVLPRRWVVE